MRWLVGDVQGCARELEMLLRAIRFDPDADELWCLGDLINRGPDSLEAMRLWRDVGGKGVLGNHDVNALLAFSGTRPRKLPTLERLFAAQDAADHLSRLRALPVLVFLPSPGDGPDAWIVHAGIDPRWADLATVASRINPGPHDDDWLLSEDVAFATRVRCCTADGHLNDETGPPDRCAAPFEPWDSFYSGNVLVVHGHWATRGYYRGRSTMGLDSGCVHGGALTAWCQEEDRVVQVPSLNRSLST